MRRVAAALVALAVAGAGCVDFVAPEPPQVPDSSPFANVNVAVSDTVIGGVPRTAVALSQFGSPSRLFPGADSVGAGRPLPAGDTLHVFGLAFLPDSISRDGGRVYGDTLFAAPIPAGGTALEVRLPPAPGFPPPLFFRWPIRSRFGPDSLVAPAEGEVVFRTVSPAFLASPPPRTVRWTLELRSPRGNFDLGGTGSPPAEIPVRTALLPFGDNGRLTATLAIVQERFFFASPCLYCASLNVRQLLRWSVRRGTPSGS